MTVDSLAPGAEEPGGTRYGHFDDGAREYVIERPDTPLPWINYLGSEGYFGIISNTAGGYSFYRDARLRRLTRYRYNNAPLDLGGRYLYVRDDDGGSYWSPSWQPVQRELEDYSCRHGLGYTVIGARLNGIAVETRYFVPLDETLEIWHVRLTNERATAANLSLFSAVEFCLWEALDDAANLQRNYSIGEVEYEDGVIFHKTEYRERRDHFAYFACSEPLSGFDTQRDAFLGPYRGWDRPIAVERGQTTNSIAHGWQPVGAHQVNVHLEAHETRDVIFVLGYAENERDYKFDPPGSQTLNKRHVSPTIGRYLKPDAANAAFDALGDYWNTQLGGFHVATGNEHVDRMVNIWNPYQCMVTFNLSRSASLYETGVGRGMGFRDSNQDLLGFVHMVPERARERLLDISATQLPSGGAYHQYQPLTKRGNDAVGSGFNDDPAWLVLAVAAYLKETGDLGVLEEQVPYDNQPGTETRLYEHLVRAIDYTIDRLRPHALPLIGRAAWNDCLNLHCFSETPGESFQTTENRSGGVAESVFIGGLFVLAAHELAAIADQVADDAMAGRCRGAANRMVTAVERDGWDGAWFRRAYDYFGHSIGSADNAEGRIFIEPQGMCIMAGIGLADGRAARALASVREMLATPHGIILQQPAYTHYALELGEISTYPPGYKENAGIFCHTNPWLMIAEAMAGNADGALDYYMRINPSAREQIADIHRCEPYVYAQMIAGRDAPTHGEAKNSWLTGTAAWNFVAISQWILGIRPSFDGLVVAPALPRDWRGFHAQRRFRGVDYDITVKRSGPGAEIALAVDGQAIAGTRVPLPPAGIKTVAVAVTVG